MATANAFKADISAVVGDMVSSAMVWCCLVLYTRARDIEQYGLPYGAGNMRYLGNMRYIYFRSKRALALKRTILCSQTSGSYGI